MVNKLIHDAAISIKEQDIINYSAYPLVRELAFTYGTQVIHISEHPIHPKFYLAREDGVCVGYALYNNDCGFGFRSVVASKERGGRTADDRYTWYSKKLASLMRTIKKDKLMPSGHEEIVQHDTKIREAIETAINSYGDTRKSGSVNGSSQHILLEIAFGNRSVHELSKESIEEFKTALDNYRKIDTIREKRYEDIRDVFSEPLWAVCYDQAGSFLVGKLSFDIQVDDDSYRSTARQIDVALPFRRVASLDEIPYIMPKMTMLKVAMQQRNYTNFHKDIMPENYSGYIEELTVMCRAARSSWDEGILKGDWIIFRE